MNRKHLTLAIGAVLVLGLAGFGLYRLGMERGGAQAPAGAPATTMPAAGPQSVAEGEDATRRHVQAGLKAGDVDPTNGQ